MLNPISNIFLLSLSLVSIVSCGNRSGNHDISAIENNDSIPAAVKQLVRAVADSDTAKFADLVSYPLSRPYPLRNLETPQEMKQYYSKIMDDSLKRVIVNSNIEDWDDYGWRGWSLNRGEYLWIDDNLYDIPYLSAVESNMLDSLRRAEISSLHPSLQKGWTPVATLVADDDSSIFRIDLNKDGNQGHPIYRLCQYEKGTDLAGIPTSILEGYKETEGTANTETYYFSGPKGESAVYEPEVPDGDMPQIELTQSDGTSNVIPVRNAYWLDLKGVTK